MMRLLCIIPYQFNPAQNGGQALIQRYMTGLSKRIPTLCAGVSGNDPYGDFKLVPVLGSSRLRYINPLLILRIRTLIINNGITHLWLEHPYMGWLGATLKKLTGVKLIIRSHNIEGYRWKTIGKWWWRILLAYEGWVHRRADLSFFISPEDEIVALERFSLHKNKTAIATYIITRRTAPLQDEKRKAKHWLHATYFIPESHSIFLFNGSFNYAPNAEALSHLIKNILPKIDETKFPYTLILTGKDIPDYVDEANYPNIRKAGFVENVAAYFLGSDLFLNPVTKGGGIKTKLVDALLAGTASISYVSGAFGIPETLRTGLRVVADLDDAAFARAVEEGPITVPDTERLLEYFGEEQVLNQVVARISETVG